LRKNTKSTVIGDATDKNAVRLDELDMKIIALLVSGKDNKQIADEVRVPLSTIQRRTRRLFEKNTVRSRIEPNYRQLGYSKGVIHLYINNVDAMAVSQELADVPGVVSVSIHIGNSDIVGEIIYKSSMEVLDLIARCKRIEGVTKVIWSEEVYSLPSVLSDKKIIAYFKPS
jgi:DNA-binding Lrp family transcriptional regulator